MPNKKKTSKASFRTALRGGPTRHGAGVATSIASGSVSSFVASRLHKLVVSAIFSSLFPAFGFAAPTDQVDVTQVPFEQLLNTEIITATKLAKQVSEASSAVSVVTAADIKTYGYRTLDDILNGMRGLYMVHSPWYGLIGGRGLGFAGDYAGRITLLIDGQHASDGFWGQSYFGADGLLDVELIDRVEYIPGPGSAIYGNSAFLGVINVITKKGNDFDGVQVAQDYGTHNWNKSRVTAGEKLDNGLEYLVSASAFSNDGRDYTTDLVTGAQGKAGNEKNRRVFIKASIDGWTLESAWVRRPLLNSDTPTKNFDENSLFSLGYDRDLGSSLKVSNRLSWGEYLGNDTSTGCCSAFIWARWFGFDTKFVATWLEKHTFVFGIDTRSDYKQKYAVSDTATGDSLFSYQSSRATDGAYFYDDYELSNKFQLNYGLRYDRRNNGREAISPRLALIYKPRETSSIKFSTGSASREPTAFVESFNVTPRTERVVTNEVVWEEKLAEKTRFIGSVYRYRVDGRIATDASGWYIDAEQKSFVTGAEVELEHLWDNGSRLRTSYAWQDARNKNNEWTIDSPRHNAKLNFTIPLVGEKLRLGVETRFLGRHLRFDQQETGGYSVTDLTFTSSQVLPGWQASLAIRNVFDRSYGDVTTNYGVDNPSAVRLFPMDGRNFWLQLSHDFK